jgi:hypothetical protein
MGVIERQPPIEVSPGIFDKAIFLAGPIQGAPDWQSSAVEVISDVYDGHQELHLFNPRRDVSPATFDSKMYAEQVKWEQDHLAMAARIGGQLFWFEPQDHALPYPEGREYAKMTKKELVMALGAVIFGRPVKFSIGIHPDFGELERYYRTTLDRLGVPIYSTLPNTCKSIISRLEI